MHHVTHAGMAQQNMADVESAIFRGVRFLRAHAFLIAALSALVIVPCIWHRRIEAGDLPSHVYNAWLARLLEQGRAPGLYIVWRWNNVLFDYLLLYSSKLLGFLVGSAVVVCVSALIFFWGVFSFLTAATGRPPWFLTPLIAMLTYGYTFNMGLFNYYLSIGLACFGLAILWRPHRWDWLAGALILALAILAHPIGALWYVATLAYLSIRRRLRGAAGLVVPAPGIALFVALHWYLAHAETWEVSWLDRPFYLFNGADQFAVYSSRYRFIAAACIAIMVVWLAREGFRWREHLPHSKPFYLLAELYLVSFVAIALLPQDLRPVTDAAWIGLLVSRLTITSAVFALGVLGCLPPRKWVLVSLSACASIYFILLYRDTVVMNRVESHAEALISKLPFGTRVISILLAPPDSRISFIQHVVDRACVEHCFTYSNYEPSSGQFRLHVAPGSPLATSKAADSQEMAAGNYTVRKTDPPLKVIYQCDSADLTVLCIRDLAVGEKTGPPDAVE